MPSKRGRISQQRKWPVPTHSLFRVGQKAAWLGPDGRRAGGSAGVKSGRSRPDCNVSFVPRYRAVVLKPERASESPVVKTQLDGPLLESF